MQVPCFSRRLSATGWRLAGLIVLLLVVSVTCYVGRCTGSHERRPVLQQGDQGAYVVLLQHYLYLLRYLDDAPDGIFGSQTRKAVILYQRRHNLEPDGIVGSMTWELLEQSVDAIRTRRYRIKRGEALWTVAREYGLSVEALARVNELENRNLIRSGTELILPLPGVEETASRKEKGELVHWDEAKELFTNFSVARVIDLETGLSFHVRRFYGHYHADAEPVTAEDTRILKQIYGGEWSWERRAVIIEIGSRRIAASINGFPHGDGMVMDNNFSGHICVHFLGSRLHQTGKVDERHQEMVLRAAGYRR